MIAVFEDHCEEIMSVSDRYMKVEFRAISQAEVLQQRSSCGSGYVNGDSQLTVFFNNTVVCRMVWSRPRIRSTMELRFWHRQEIGFAAPTQKLGRLRFRDASPSYM